MITFSESNSSTGNPPRVLIVDPDPSVVRELSALVRDRGCEPLEATTFEEGRRLWSLERPEMLIADVRLGQFNGLQLLLRARADRPGVTATITSTHRDAVLEEDTRRFGATFVVKPCDPQTIIESLFGSQLPSRADTPIERRTGDRRHVVTPNFLPDRRVAERRRVDH